MYFRNHEIKTFLLRTPSRLDNQHIIITFFNSTSDVQGNLDVDNLSSFVWCQVLLLSCISIFYIYGAWSHMAFYNLVAMVEARSKGDLAAWANVEKLMWPSLRFVGEQKLCSISGKALIFVRQVLWMSSLPVKILIVLCWHKMSNRVQIIEQVKVILNLIYKNGKMKRRGKY